MRPNNAHMHLSKGPSLLHIMAWRLFGARPIFWTTDGMLIKGSVEISPWDLKQNKTLSSDIYIWICYVQNDVHIYRASVCTHLFQYSFYELWLYVRRHVPYCDWWLSWQRLNALMIVSKFYYIAIQKHILPSVHYSDVNMNICISTESTILNHESSNSFSLPCDIICKISGR